MPASRAGADPRVRGARRDALAPAARQAPFAPYARTLALLLVLACTALAVPPAPAAAPAPWRGGPTPSLALKDLEGREVRLDAYRGRTVIVNFWATWCAPCVEEMPSLKRLRDRYSAQGLEVLAVNFQENAQRIRPFLDRYSLDFTALRDHDGSARQQWGVTVFPSSFVVAPDGRVAFVVVGEADWDRAPIEPRIRELLFP